MQKFNHLIILLISIFLFGSCGSYNPCTKLYYKSIRPTVVPDEERFPIDEASIAVYTVIRSDDKVDIIVQNLTDDILTIDQTKSFFISNSKKSHVFYDPTIGITTNSSSTTTGSGKTFNLGGIANAFGIGGVAGSLMRATTLGSSSSDTNVSTYTEVVADLPQVSIGPRGQMAINKTFNIGSPNFYTTSATPENSPQTFSVVISYSFDAKNFDTIVSDFYCNSNMNIDVYGRKTSEAVRQLIQSKPNATVEPWFNIYTDRSWDKIKNYSTFINYK